MCLQPTSLDLVPAPIVFDFSLGDWPIPPNGGRFVPLETAWNIGVVIAENVSSWKKFWRTVFDDFKQVLENRCA